MIEKKNDKQDLFSIQIFHKLYKECILHVVPVQALFPRIFYSETIYIILFCHLAVTRTFKPYFLAITNLY